MKRKIDIFLNENTLESAKEYARLNETNLSEIVESYLSSLPKQEEITPLVKSLSGVIELPNNFNEKDIYGEYLIQKYQ